MPHLNLLIGRFKKVKPLELKITEKSAIVVLPAITRIRSKQKEIIAEKLKTADQFKIGETVSVWFLFKEHSENRFKGVLHKVTILSNDTIELYANGNYNTKF